MATVVFVAVTAGVALVGCGTTKAAPEGSQPEATAARPSTVEMPYDEQIKSNAKRMLEEGQGRLLPRRSLCHARRSRRALRSLPQAAPVGRAKERSDRVLEVDLKLGPPIGGGFLSSTRCDHDSSDEASSRSRNSLRDQKGHTS